MSLKFNLLIGIECHVHLNFIKKIFNFNKFKDNLSFNNHNNEVSYYDLGLPGTLPIFNCNVFNKIILFGLFLKVDIYNISFFFRKSYFYPDVSKNYQLTQHNNSLFKNGFVLIYNNFVFFPYYKKINIIQIHLEEDTGKIIYKNNLSLLNYNRSGCALLEIVCFADISNFQEAYLYIINLKYIITFFNLSDCSMELGKFRFDINISIKLKFDFFSKFKIELKNLNSLNYFFNALNYEIKRLLFFYLNGDFISSHTRGYDNVLNVSYFIRKKENIKGYKYFEDPDLFYILFDKSFFFICLNKFWDWFLFYKKFFFKIKFISVFYFIFYKKYFYLFFIFGFYYTDYSLFLILIFNKILSYKFLFKTNIFFSFNQLFFLFNLLFYKSFNKRTFFVFIFFLINKNILNNFFLYKIIYYNKLIKNTYPSLLNFNLNSLIFINLSLFHNYIFDKKVISNFIFTFFKDSSNFDLFFNFFFNKIFIYREMDEGFKSRN